MTNNIPSWVLEFNKRIKELEIIAGDKNWYDFSQPILTKLKETGRGNCVAWAKLMKEIALASDLVVKIIYVTIGDRYENKNNSFPHKICVMIDNDKAIWYQSNVSVRKFKIIRTRLTGKAIERAIKQIARENGKEMGYKTGTTIYRIWKIRE